MLGEIVPQSISAEVLEGSAGPQIVVQGADQTGGEFKITLAQQLLIAQHILEQAQVQRAQSSAGETSEGQITTGGWRMGHTAERRFFAVRSSRF